MTINDLRNGLNERKKRREEQTADFEPQFITEEDRTYSNAVREQKSLDEPIVEPSKEDIKAKAMQRTLQIRRENADFNNRMSALDNNDSIFAKAKEFFKSKFKLHTPEEIEAEKNKALGIDTSKEPRLPESVKEASEMDLEATQRKMQIGAIGQANQEINKKIEEQKASDEANYGTAEAFGGENGNIDINHRKVAYNEDGSISTENSITVTEEDDEGNEKYVVIPTIIDGKQVSDDEAIAEYEKTGLNLGKFNNEEDSERYAENLHQRQGRFYLQEQSDYLKENYEARQKEIENSAWYKNFTKESQASKNKEAIYADGYQFGDVSRIVIQDALATGATIGDLTLHVIDAFEGTGLNLASLIMNGVATAGDIIGLDEGADRLRRAIGASTTLSSQAYNALDPYSISGRTSDAIAQGIGYSSEMALFSWALGGLKGAEELTEGAKLLEASKKVKVTADAVKIFGFEMPMLTMLSSTGGALREGYSQEDYNKWLVNVNALGEGVIDGFTESIFDTLGVGGSPFADRMKGSVMSHIKGGLSKAIARTGMNMVGEGAEEVLGYVLNWGLHNGMAILDENLFEGDGSNWREKFNSEEMWEAFWTSALSTLLSEGATTFAGTTNEVSQAIAQMETTLGRELSTGEQKVIANKVLLNRELNYQHNYMDDYVNHIIDSSDITDDQKKMIKTIYDMSYHNEVTTGVGLSQQNTGMNASQVEDLVANRNNWNTNYNKYKLGNEQINSILNSDLNDEAKERAQKLASEKNYSGTQVRKSIGQMKRYDKNLSNEALAQKQATRIENERLLEAEQQTTQEEPQAVQTPTSEEIEQETQKILKDNNIPSVKALNNDIENTKKLIKKNQEILSQPEYTVVNGVRRKTFDRTFHENFIEQNQEKLTKLEGIKEQIDSLSGADNSQQFTQEDKELEERFNKLLEAEREKAKNFDASDSKNHSDDVLYDYKIRDIEKEVGNKRFNDFFNEHESDFDDWSNQAVQQQKDSGVLTNGIYNVDNNLVKLTTTREGDKLFIDELYVEKQKQGTGTKVIKALQEYADKAGLTIETSDELSSAKGFWDKALSRNTEQNTKNANLPEASTTINEDTTEEVANNASEEGQKIPPIRANQTSPMVDENLLEFREETNKLLNDELEEDKGGDYGLGTKNVRHEETGLRNEFLSDELKNKMREEGLDQYSVLSNKKEVEEADKRIRNAGTDESGNVNIDRGLQVEYKNLMEKFNSGKRIDAFDVATAEILIQQFSFAGKTDEAMDVLSSLATMASEYGQAIQALRLINNATPAGQAMFMEKIANRMSKKTNTIVRLSEETLNEIKNAKPDSQELKNAKEKAELEIANQMPPTFFEKLDNWRYMAMLANPTTHIRNIFGNVGMHTMQSLKNGVSGLIQDVYYKGKGEEVKRTASLIRRSSKEQRNFAKNDAVRMVDSMETGSKYEKDGGKEKTLKAIEDKRRDFDSDILNAISKKNTWALDVEDTKFMQWAYRDALQNYMSANQLEADGVESDILLTKENLQSYIKARDALDKLDPNNEEDSKRIKELTAQIKQLEDSGKKNLKDARTWAVREAQEATFHQYNALASALNAFVQKSLQTDIDGLNKKTSAGKLLVDALVPYKRTPLNIASTAIQYSPIGLLRSTGGTIVSIVDKGDQIKALYNNKNTLLEDDLKAKRITEQQYKRRVADNNQKMNEELANMVNKNIDNMAKGLTGSMLFMIGMALQSGGAIKLKGGNDGEDDEFEEKALGKQEYSLIIGDKVSIPIDWLAPSAIPFIAGANFNREITEGTDLSFIEKLAKLPEASLGVVDPIVDLSMLQGLQSSFSAFGDSWKNEHQSEALLNFFTEAGLSYLSQYQPTVMGRVARQYDPVYRDTSSTKEGLAGTVNRWAKQRIANIPGLSTSLPAKKDWDGTDMTRDDNLPTATLLRIAGDNKSAQWVARGFGRLLENFVFPDTVTEVKDDKVAKALLDVYEKTGDSTLFRNAQTVGKSFKINDEQYRYDNREEYSQAKEQYGKLLYSELENLVDSDNYNNLSNTEKNKAINTAQSYAYNKLLQSYAEEHDIEYKEPRSIETVEAIKDAGGSSASYYQYMAGTDGMEKTAEKVDYLKDMNISKKEKQAIYTNTVTSSETEPDKIKDIDINKYLTYKDRINEITASKGDGESVKNYEKIQTLLDGDYTDDEIDKIYSRFIQSKDDTSWENIKLLSKGSTSDIKAFLQYKVDSSDEDWGGDKEETNKIKADGTPVYTTKKGTKQANLEDYLADTKLTNLQRLYIYGTQYKFDGQQKAMFESYLNDSGLSVKQKQQILGKIKGVTLYNDGSYDWKTSK